MKIVFVLFFLLNLGWSIFVSAFPPPDECTKPCVILRDSYDREVNDNNQLGLSDSLFGSFFNLEPEKKYHLSIMRDGKEISKLCLRSDQRGVITTCALLWSMGFDYDPKTCQKKIDQDFDSQTYCLKLRDDNNKTVIDRTIPVTKEKSFIYTCDSKGNPQNTFIRNKDDVYLKAQNSAWPEEKDTKVYIYVVKDRWSWRLWDKLDDKDLLMQKHVAVLGEESLQSPHLIWNKDDLGVGSYDIIASCKNLGIIFNNDLIDSNYGVGFKIIGKPKNNSEEPGDIIQELVCQAPPHDLCRGNLEQPHRAIYKDYFSPQEEIWVAVEIPDPTPEQIKAKQVRIYVIEHQEGKPLKDGDELHDVSGGYEEVLLQPDCAHGVFTRVWCAPEVREQGYDVVIDFKNSNHRFGTYDKGLDILDNVMKTGCEERVGTHRVNGKEVEHGGFYVPEKWVCLESLTFDYTNTLISDAITLKYQSKNDLRPEWMRGEKSFPAAYVKYSPITLKPKFIASREIDEAIFAAYTNSGNLGNVIIKDIFFNNQQEKKPDNRTCPMLYNVSCYRESKDHLLQVRHNTPDRIQSFYQQWDWYLKDIDNYNDVHIGSTINKIYIVLSAPQYPWTSERDSAPWPDVLDLFCQVAYSEYEPGSAAKKITQFLYDEVGAKYDRGACPYSKENDPYSDFLVKKFFDNIPQVGKLNCYDMGKALVTFGNILGCNLTLRYCDRFGQLNCIKLVGSLSCSCNECWCCDECFNNHAFASIEDNVFDASLKADSWGSPALPPYRDAWMINIPWGDYKEMVAKKKCGQIPYPQIVLFKLDTQTQN